jgi:Flp pilus assembly protein protease CpaA
VTAAATILLITGLVVSVEDIRSFTIPDILSLGGLLLLILYDTLFFAGRLPDHLAAASVAGLWFTALRLLAGNRLGLGDVKLSLLAGGAAGTEALPAGFLLTGLLTMLAFLYRRAAGRKGGAIPLAPLMIAAFLLAGTIPLQGEDFSGVDFENQDTAVILRYLAKAGNFTLLADETVSGKTSFHSGPGTVGELLDLFCRQNHLFYSWNENSVTVSRIRLEKQGDGTLDCDAEQVRPGHLTDRLARDLGITIFAENIPPDPVTLHIRSGTVSNILLLLIRRYPQLILDTDGSAHYIRRRQGQEQTVPPGGLVRSDTGLYSVNLRQVRARDLLTELITAEGRDFSLLVRSDPVLENIALKDRTFTGLLTLICLQSGLAWTDSGGVLYIHEAGGQDILKRFQVTERHPLRYRRAEEIMALLPPGLTDGALLRTDPAGNSLIVTASPDRQKEFAGVIADLDTEIAEWPIRLHGLTAEEFLKAPPCGFPPVQFRKTGSTDLLYFRGSRDQYHAVLKESCRTDLPDCQIIYQLLVIQYQEGDSLKWEPSVTATLPDPGGQPGLLGTLGGCIDLTFDVTTALGILFAFELGTGINQSRARVLADTSLTGLSGESVRFQNTGTTRYRDMERDPVTGELKATGVTREITSGLFLEITGKPESDGSVILTISATVSRQGTDTTGNLGALPPTSEKIIKTTLRAKPGEPVSIGGLIQEEVVRSVDKVPLLGDIPLLGLLFQKRKETVERTELVIYLIPVVTDGPEDPFRRLWRLFFPGDSP